MSKDSSSTPRPETSATMPWSGLFPAVDYAVDAWQRTILYWDVMRQRGNQYQEHIACKTPNVLSFEFEVVLDGRSLDRPVNYYLVRITPPAGSPAALQKRPIVVVDPRAGHGPGIGGFRADSEIGVAMREGHPCYFIGFLPEPVRGQTVEDVIRAQGRFLEKVIELNPEALHKPLVIGNCQAGWAVMMLAAARPELFGAILVAGAPLSYWGGVHGESPMRYSGGLLGGSWMTALAGDLGNGKFDGTHLVSNFENLNPANTLWTKQFNLWANADSEAERYLGFERWWGGHVLLNADEMQLIVDELFIGNKLATAEIVTKDGVRLDLREIKAPIVCFCSKGDNITPPPQALGWILDLYDSVEDILAQEQTIVYAVHDSIGHLGIFVSGKVAKKEYAEFTSNIDLIDVLPPGLYEAVLLPKSPDDDNADLILGDYLLRFEARTLDDIRALGGNDEEDERRFAAAARVSEINLGLYRTFVQPWLRAAVSEPMAAWLRRMHPLRLQFELLSDANPLMRPVAQAAEWVRANRAPADRDNPFVQAQGQMSEQVVAALDGYRDARDRLMEETFLGVYGTPLLQAMVGLRASDAPPRAKPGEDPDHLRDIGLKQEELRGRIAEGGPREAAIRAMIYVRMPAGAVDERGFNTLRRISLEHGRDLPVTRFKELLREQFFMLLLDEAAAIEALPVLLRGAEETAGPALEQVRSVVTAAGPLTGEAATRFARIERIFEAAAAGRRTPMPLRAVTADDAGETKKAPRRSTARRRGGDRRQG
jgi:pimeloyl-ACP methyl ester carboxylesterase